MFPGRRNPTPAPARPAAVQWADDCALPMSEDETPAPIRIVEGGDYFCANPACVLHVREGDPGVRGHGNWARLPDGREASRSRFGAVMLCDACGRAALAADPAR